MARCNHTATVYKDSLIIFGGWDGTRTLNDMYELSLTTHIWYHIYYKSELTPPPVYRHGCIILGDNLTVFGGINEFSEKFNELYSMNFKTKTWSIFLPAGEYPVARTYHSLCYYEDKVLLFGGYSNKALDDCYSLTYRHKAEDSEETIMKDSYKTEIICGTSDEVSKDMLKNQINELKLKYENEIAKNCCKVI